MRTQGSGHIVLVSSMDGKKGVPPDAPYVVAKFALAGFGDVLRQELHGTGVDVTTVFPGRVDTPLIATLKVPWISAKIPPEAVARAIVTAIRRRQAEVIVPFRARLLLWANALSPRLGDWAVRTFRLEGWEN
jgi:short-subunit dehydrogenase